MNKKTGHLFSCVAMALLTLVPIGAQADNVTVITSALADSSYLRDQSTLSPQPGFAGGLDIRLYPDVKYQTFMGFGTSMNDANAAAAMRLSPEKRREAMRLLFSTDGGNGYVFCRVPMGSNDFSTCDYTCVKQGDKRLKTFNINHDKKYIIPMLGIARELSPSVRLLVSPWSPPAYMKTNGTRIHGGKLKADYRGQWAEYFAKFIKAYAAEGLTTEFVTIQNEPEAVHSWESCIWTGEDEGVFAANYLRPRLDAEGLDSVKIFFWDHNRNRVVERAKATLGVPGARQALAGIAYHWYEGDGFPQLRAFHELNPDMIIMESEFCTGPNKGRTTMPYGVWGDLELFAHELIGDLNNFTNIIIDFNPFLDTKAGPFHNRGVGGIPNMVVDAASDKFTPQPNYYAMAHFSRYIRPGAQILLSTCSDEGVGLEVTAAKNTDGSLVCVVLNRSGRNRSTKLLLSDKTVRDKVMLPAHSLTTIILKP